jgi:hypothetical protein
MTFMKTSIYTKIFVLLLVVCSALALISYSHAKTAQAKEDSSGSGKCSAKTVQSEFIIWESFSKGMLFGTTGCDEN